MIKSMTGFGRAEAVSRERKVSVELKSVNHRYLDLNIKMPKRLSYFEGDPKCDEDLYPPWQSRCVHHL